MELLIPGLILVALMVYASTRIKRSAARAFEAEHIKGDGYSLDKPEGFLHRIDNESEYAFEAYSKDFGKGPAEDVRAATAVVIKRESDLQNTENLEKARLAHVSAVETFELAGTHCSIVRGERVRDGHAFDVSSKLFEAGYTTFTLRVEVLRELVDDFTRKIEEMLISFGPR